MKKALIVAYYFPPVAATGAMRPLGFCRYLESYGWLPCVITTSPDSVYPPHPVDENLLAKVPEGVKIDVVPYSSQLDRLLRVRVLVCRWLGVQGRGGHDPSRNIPELHQADLKRSDAVGRLSKLKRFALDWLFSFPDPQSAWVKPVLRHIATLAGNDAPDIVFATGSPWTSLVIGKAIAHRYAVPLVVDFRDPWASNAEFHYTSPFLIKKTKALERQICARAACVIANTEELRAQLRALYPEIEGKCVALPNGFHADDFPRLGEEKISNTSESRRQGFELSHFGTMYMMRTPDNLLRALVELVEEEKVSSDRLRLRFVGVWDIRDADCERMAQDLEKHGLLKRDTPIGHRECLSQMAKADALLIMQPGSTLQIPAKIYEYLATQRPIVVIGDPGATFNLVERYRLGACCPNRVSAIKELLLRIVSGSDTLKSVSEEMTAEFDYRVLTGKLADIFNRVCTIA